MSQMTAVGVIAKGSRDACIALARILLSDGCQLTRKGDEWEISFAVESRPVMLTDDPWNGLECGIPMIRYEDDDYNEYDEEDDNGYDEEADNDCEVVYEQKNLIDITKELQLDVKILNIPLEQDYPTYIHMVNGQCKSHIIFVPPYDESVEEMLEDYDEEDFEDNQDQYLPGCDPEYRSVDELDDIWHSQFCGIYAEHDLEYCFEDMCIPFEPQIISKLNQ